MEKLKRCPFCGGYAQLQIEDIDGYDGWHSYMVCCMGCGTHRARGRFYDNGMEEMRFLAKLKAIEAWNRRANDDQT
jgi:Lar family restriction alleviation protein